MHLFGQFFIMIIFTVKYVSLQDVFYVVAIITMIVHIVVLIAVVSILMAIQKKVAETADAVERRVENVKNFVTHPNVVATSVGKIVLGQLMTRIGKIFRR